jgi:rRNA maturation RNase YbeY
VGFSFHSEQVKFDINQKLRHKAWIRNCIHLQNKNPGEIAFIFTSNERILELNRSYLNHNDFTDVITFDYSSGDRVSGDIFISVEEVKKNAAFYEVDVEHELRRVMIHGIFHLLGFDDRTEKEAREMREMEDEALHLWLKEEQDDIGL